MPEITGISGGLGAMQGGGGLGSDIGFTMPEIDFFGAKQVKRLYLLFLLGALQQKDQMINSLRSLEWFFIH